MSDSDGHTSRSEEMHPLDALAAAPDHHKVLLENDRVRVLDTSIEPGEQTPIHTHQWPGALYMVSWSDFVRFDAEGNVLVDSRGMATKPEPGTTIWSAPLPPHFARNVGTGILRVIAIEVKPA